MRAHHFAPFGEINYKLFAPGESAVEDLRNIKPTSVDYKNTAATIGVPTLGAGLAWYLASKGHPTPGALVGAGGLATGLALNKYYESKPDNILKRRQTRLKELHDLMRKQRDTDVTTKGINKFTRRVYNDSIKKMQSRLRFNADTPELARAARIEYLAGDLYPFLPHISRDLRPESITASDASVKTANSNSENTDSRLFNRLSETNPEILGNDLSARMANRLDSLHRNYTREQNLELSDLVSKYEVRHPVATTARRSLNKISPASMVGSGLLIVGSAAMDASGNSTAKKYALPVGLTGFGIGGGLMLADKLIPKSPWDPESNAQKQLTSILKKTNTQVDAKRRPKLLEALKPGSEFRSTLGKYQTWLDKNNYDTGSVFDEVAIGKDLINMMDRRGLLNKKYTHDLDIDAEIAAI